MVSYASVLAAAQRIRGSIYRTPVLTSELVDLASGVQCHFKAEHLQRTGSFKYRGATNAVGAHEAATDRHAAGEAAARAEVCGLRSRNQTLESQLKISGAKNEVLAARLEEEAAARKAAEAQAAGAKSICAELATRVEALRREAEQAAAAQAEQDEKVKRSFSFRVSFPRSFSVTSARSSREERPSRSFSTPMYDPDDDGPAIYGI